MYQFVKNPMLAQWGEHLIADGGHWANKPFHTTRCKKFIGWGNVLLKSWSPVRLVVEQPTHHQIAGEPIKFLTLADWTGMVETELFAKTCKNYGLLLCVIQCWKLRL
jgi:hypothetical protein